MIMNLQELEKEAREELAVEKKDIAKDIGDVLVVLDVYQVTDDVKLTKMTRRKFVNIFPDVTSETGNPLEYSEFRRRLYWRPRPGVVMTMQVDYLRRVGNMSATTDTPPFVSYFDPCLYQLAKAWWHDNVDPDPGKSKNYRNQYEEMMRKFVKNAPVHPDTILVAKSHWPKRERRLDFVSPAGQ